METCRSCGAEWPDGTASCEECGADLTGADPVVAANADFDQEAERERFQARYGIDIGDRTVDEYLDYLDRQDYTVTPWFWLIVAVEVASVALIAYGAFGPGGWDLVPVLFGMSVLLAAGIYGDTARVGLFRRWATIRWLYIVVPLVPLWGQIAAFLYLLLRRLKREQQERERRRLFESGFDLEASAGGD